MKTNKSISVVIATLGGEFLETTLKKLNEGIVIPDEILVCVPKPEIDKFSLLLPNNTRLLESPNRGQVAQRAYGLGVTSGDYILQLDDDVFLPKDGLKILIESIEQAGSSVAISPLFKDCNTGAYLTNYYSNLRGLLRSIFATLIGGAAWGARRMGTIDKSGVPYAIDSIYCNEIDLVPVDWLPGGCVLTRRDDLIFENYYPFEGKAFSEDIIHSLIWRQRGIRLFVVSKLAACTYLAQTSYSLSIIYSEYRARKIVVCMIKGSLWRCQMRFGIRLIRLLFSLNARLFRG